MATKKARKKYTYNKVLSEEEKAFEAYKKTKEFMAAKTLTGSEKGALDLLHYVKKHNVREYLFSN